MFLNVLLRMLVASTYNTSLISLPHAPIFLIFMHHPRMLSIVRERYRIDESPENMVERTESRQKQLLDKRNHLLIPAYPTLGFLEHATGRKY